jgi:hypothetical protein
MIHRNGIMIIRFSLAIASFNLLVAFLPTTTIKFNELYGYGGVNTLFYFAIPSYIMIKFNHNSLLKRSLYATSVITMYTGFKLLYDREKKSLLSNYFSSNYNYKYSLFKNN